MKTTGVKSRATTSRAVANTIKANARQAHVQTKLTVGQPGDKYEQEADQVADQVMSMTGPQVQRQCMSCDEKESAVQTKPLSENITPWIQRQVEEEELQMKPFLQRQTEEEEEEPVQAKPSNGQRAKPSVVSSAQLHASECGGQPLAASTRSFFEPRFGHDFSNVKVHTCDSAVQMNRNLNAQAFTHGSNIFFNRGKYNPGTSHGKNLLAHELTHVVQQNSGLNRFIQTKIGDGHDLTSPRFVSDTALQNIYDGSGTLKKGDKNESVRKVQHGIHDSGILFLGHGIDGKFGKQTERYVKRFQKRKRITTDPKGVVGAATIEKLDKLFPATSLPSGAGSAFKFPTMLQILCAWNSSMIKDLKKLYVHLVSDLKWADERFDGTSWVAKPMDGSGETVGHTIFIATDDKSENVASSLYHEYQHARAPYVYRSRSWGDEESYVFRTETDWAISRGITPDPSLTKKDAKTGKTVTNVAGISSAVESYPGLDKANPGEVIGKVRSNPKWVWVSLNGRNTKRKAKKNDSVPGKRVIKPPRHRVRDKEWKC